ncbi:MAG: hypothetical protein HGA79_05335 [Anaerolineales bacterium]|nr:hypothetical protein [Anaerolineales bacterium]
MKTLNRTLSTSLSIAVLAVLLLSTCSPKVPFPLSEPGPYDFGTRGGFSREYVFMDASSDGLWQAMTDERICAVIPMAPEGAMLFGERGLAEVDRPMLILVGTEDTGCDYNCESVFIYEHLGTPDKTLISFIGETHDMLFSDEPYLRMKHFVAAFFGYHLQGRQEYADYFSKKLVSRQAALAWGIYEK